MYQGPPQGPPPGPYGYGPPPPQQQPMGYYPPQQPAVVYVQPQMIKAPFNHTVHIVLDLLSCGCWLPIHLICWLAH